MARSLTRQSENRSSWVGCVMDERLPSIESAAEVAMSEAVTACCALGNGRFATGGASGELRVHEADALLGSAQLGSAIVGLVASRDAVIAAAEISGLSAFHGEPLWLLEIDSGSELLAASGDAILVADSAGGVTRVTASGENVGRKEHGEVHRMDGSADGLTNAVGLRDGTLVIFDDSGQTLHESLASEDDIETISHLAFRSDGVLLASRDSMGMTLDERPENRLECWHAERGLIHTAELPARVTSILPTESGVLVGCQNGSLIEMSVGGEAVEKWRSENPISAIIEWGDDLIIGTWFNAERIAADGSLVWSYEHAGLITSILDIGADLIAVIGEAPAGQSPAPIILLDPDAEPRIPEDEDLEYEFTPSSGASTEFAGGLSDEELAAADAPPEAASDASDLIDALAEEMEILPDDPVVSQSDLLADLSASARAINLPPIADAGEDTTLPADDDGTATILLDGSRSYDPDGHIESYAWQDAKGRVIGNTAQVRVRLRAGTHPFELTVTDDKGAATTAIVTVRIQ